MGTALEYQKVMHEIVFVNLPGPEEPKPGMTGGELVHGFLADLYRAKTPELKNFVDSLCGKWSIHYRMNGE